MNFLSTKCSLNNTYQAICLWIVESWEICDSLVPTQKALDTKLLVRRRPLVDVHLRSTSVHGCLLYFSQLMSSLYISSVSQKTITSLVFSLLYAESHTDYQSFTTTWQTLTDLYQIWYILQVKRTQRSQSSGTINPVVHNGTFR